jgi:HSP20 family molecular chaperone IbpA
LAYLIRKNRATEGLDRKQTELTAENNQLEIKVKSQAGENEITHGLILHEKRVEEELRKKLEKLKAKLATGPT